MLLKQATEIKTKYLGLHLSMQFDMSVQNQEIQSY